MREYRYQVDREGRIFHDGSEIVDPLVLRFFLRAMTRTADGRYLVVCQGERNWFEAEETPFVVQRLRLVGEAVEPRGVELLLAGDYREPLDPATLEAEGGALYCRVRRGAFRARFGRVALQQLAPLLREAGGGPVLVLAGQVYPLRDAGSPGRSGTAALPATEGWPPASSAPASSAGGATGGPTGDAGPAAGALRAADRLHAPAEAPLREAPRSPHPSDPARLDPGVLERPARSDPAAGEATATGTAPLGDATAPRPPAPGGPHPREPERPSAAPGGAPPASPADELPTADREPSRAAAPEPPRLTATEARRPARPAPARAGGAGDGPAAPGRRRTRRRAGPPGQEGAR